MIAQEPKVCLHSRLWCILKVCIKNNFNCAVWAGNSKPVFPIGFKFWKAGNRKLFAVKKHKGKGRIRKLSDDEDDGFEPLSKRHSGGSKAILREISEIKENLASVFKLSASMKTKLPLDFSVRHSSVTFAVVSP